MPRASRSLVARMRRWRLLAGNAEALLAEVPHIGKEVEDLKDLAEQLTALQAEQVHFRGKVREVTARIRRLAARGDRIRGRVGATLRGRYGFDSAVLIQAGFKPRQSKARLDEEDRNVISPPERPPARPKASKRPRSKGK